MAPRLRRWGLVAVAGALLAVWLLLPSGESMLFGPPGEEWFERDPLKARQRAVTGAIVLTQYRIDSRRQGARFEEVVRSARARGADPVVFAADTAAMKLQGAADAHLDTLWGKLPTRDPRLLTVAILHGDGDWFNLPAAMRNDSLCGANVESFAQYRGMNSLDWAVGKCALRERYGPVGKGWARWLDETRALEPDLTRTPYSRYVSTAERARPWFGEVEDDVRRWEDWGPGGYQERLILGCARGTPVSCRKAFGVGETDTTSYNRWSVRYINGWRYDVRPTLPGAVYRELGEDGFAKLWRTDTTIAAGYEQIRGEPIDGLLQRIVLAMVGSRPKDIGLSSLGWVGALIWLGLLGTWAAYRMNDRRIGG